MFKRDNYDISAEDAQKSASIRRHTADLAILDFEAGTPFFWDNEGIAFKRMVSIKTGYYYQHNTIPMIYAAREHGYTDCRWGGILALKGAHLYKQDDGVELEVWANEVSVPKKDDNGNPVYDKNGHAVEEMVKLSRPQIKVERLYNGSAISGLGAEPELPYNWMEKNETKKRLLANCKAKLVFDQTENNFYVKDTDTIHMVPEEKWKNKDEFLVELYHCIAHSTLIDSRAGKNPFFLDLKKRCGQTNYAVEELVVEMATYRFRTKYGLKISDTHKTAHSEYLTRWADEIDRNPNMLNYTYSDSYAILNYVNDHIVQFTKEEQKAIRYKFNYWKKKNNQKAAVKEYQQRETSKSISSSNKKELSQKPTKYSKSKVNSIDKPAKANLAKPEDHGTIKRICPVYHPDYGKGYTQEYISENGKAKIEIIFGDGSPGTGTGLYSLAQLKAKHSKWYFGNEAISKAEAYYEAQKQTKTAVKDKLLAQAASRQKLKAANANDVATSEIKLGQVILSKSTGKGVIAKIYKDENNVDMVNVKYPIMTLSYKLAEIQNSERFTITDEIKNVAATVSSATKPLASDSKVTAPAEAKHETEIVKQTAKKPVTAVHEHQASKANVVEEITKEPRKDYHRKLNSQEAAIADTVVRYVRNIPAEKQHEYGSSIKNTSEEFAKANNIPTPPPIQTAAIKAQKKSRLVNVTTAHEAEQTNALEHTRKLER